MKHIDRDRSKLVRLSEFYPLVEYYLKLQDDRIRESVRKEIKSLFDIGCIQLFHYHLILRLDQMESIYEQKVAFIHGVFNKYQILIIILMKVAAPTLHIETCMLLLAITVQRNVHSKLLDVDGAID